jgi:hypothetical protein
MRSITNLPVDVEGRAELVALMRAAATAISACVSLANETEPLGIAQRLGSALESWVAVSQLVSCHGEAAWSDHKGRVWLVPTTRGPLSFTRNKTHAVLRDYVFDRDGHQCRACGSDRYLQIDHIISRFNGGSHHPNNLQTLCATCNSRKGISDSTAVVARSEVA